MASQRSLDKDHGIESNSLVKRLKVLNEKQRKNSAEEPQIVYSRRVSIMDQADALNKPKDSIKKSVFSRLVQRASLAPSKSSESVGVVKIAMAVPKSKSEYQNHLPTLFQKEESERDQSLRDSGFGLASSLDSIPYIDHEDDDEHEPMEVSGPKISFFRPLKNEPERFSRHAPHRKKSIHEENTETWRKLSKQMVICKKLIKDQERKKHLKKMWKKNYAGMCNRAIVLDKVVNEACRQGMKIKPVVLWSAEAEAASENKKVKKKYIGLGRKYYGFSPATVDGREFTALAEATFDDAPVTNNIVSLRLATSNFRLNMRTRSVDVLLMAPKRRLRIQELRKRNSIHLTLDCNDEKVHESIMVEEAAEAAPIRRILAYRNSIDSCNTEVSRLFSDDLEESVANEPVSRPRSDSPEARPVERAIEARSGSEDGLGSMVRCLHFAETFIANRKFIYS